MGSGVLLAGPEEHNLLLAAITGLVSMEFNQLPLLLPVPSCSRVELQKLHFLAYRLRLVQTIQSAMEIPAMCHL